MGLLRANRGTSARLFLAAVIVSAAWGALAALDQLSSKRISWHLTLAADHLRSGLWAVFLLGLLPTAAVAGAGRWRRLASHWGMRLVVLLALASLALNLGVGLLPDDPDRATRWAAMLQLGWSVAGLLLVEQVFRNQAEQSLWSAKPLCLGLAGLFIYDLYLYSQVMMFGDIDLDVADARGLAHALAVALLFVASRRHARWLAKVEISQAAGLLFGLAAAGGRLPDADGRGRLLRARGPAAAGVGRCRWRCCSRPWSAWAWCCCRPRCGRGCACFWARTSSAIATTTARSGCASPPCSATATIRRRWARRWVRGLADMVEAQGGGLWLKAIGEAGCVQSAAWNLPEIPVREPLDSPFCTLMREREWLFRLDAGPQQAADREATAVLPAWLRELPNAWVVVPLIVGDQLNGFVVLTRPRAPVELNWEVRDLLKTAARQAAAFLAQMHATEALLEARKFEAFNRMSAFVVHDLKNIVTQLALMLKNAERHRDNPEFQADMLETVQNSVEKMRQMMLQLREGQRPTVGSQAGVELAPIAERLQHAARQRGRELELQLIDRVATRGHAERLERVIGHVVQNALEATPPSGKVWLRLQQSAGRAVVEIGDTGAGMTPEFVQNRLFRPFNSTKTSGMGIGTFESFQYVKELGGRIDVESEPGTGTLVTLLLPLFDLRTGSDLHAKPTLPGALLP